MPEGFDLTYEQMRLLVVDPLNDGVNNDSPHSHAAAQSEPPLTDENPGAPHNADGYIARLTQDIPNLDPIILDYLNEGLQTFRINCLLSSTIALSYAAENTLLLLLETYSASLQSPMEKHRFDTFLEGQSINARFPQLRRDMYNDLRQRLPIDLKDGLDAEMHMIFDFVRQPRNDSGHPAGKKIERERVYANLIAFPTYIRKVYALMHWLIENPKKWAGGIEMAMDPVIPSASHFRMTASPATMIPLAAESVIHYEDVPVPPKTGSHYIAGPPAILGLFPIIGYFARHRELFWGGLTVCGFGAAFCVLGLCMSMARKESVTRTWIVSLALNALPFILIVGLEIRLLTW